MEKPLKSFKFHTVIGDVMRPYTVHGRTVTEAVNDLREMLYDGETIVGWKA
jgi:hypothetical protein